MDERSDELELRHIVGILRRRKWIFIGTVLLLVAISVLFTALQTPVYRAQADVLVRPPAGATSNVSNPVYSPEALANALRVARSSVVTGQVRELGYTAVDLTVETPGDADVFVFRAEGADPVAATEAANAYAEVFVQRQRQEVLAEYDTQAQVIRERVADIDVQLADLDAQQAAAEADVPIDSPVREEQLELIDSEFASLEAPLRSQRSSYVSDLENLAVSITLAQSGGTEVLEPATEPTSPVSPDLTRNALTALVVGLVLAVGLVFAFDHFDRSIRSEEELAAVSKLPTLAMIPLVHKPKGTGASVFTDADDSFSAAEAIRGLRAAMQFLVVQRDLHVVQVTSPRPGDGKTTVAVNLAVATARAGQKVALVDGDLRNPSVHKVFGLQGRPGLSEMLTDEADAAGTVRLLEGEPNLFVFTAGQGPADPSELLAGKRTLGVLGEIAERVDLVVVDSPPVLAVSDPLVLAGLVDGVLVVASSGVDRSQVERTLTLLRQVDAPLMGTTFNRLTAKDASAYGYGYGYAYAYRYTAGEPREARGNGSGKPGWRRRGRGADVVVGEPTSDR